MSAEENKVVIRRLFEEAVNQGDMTVVDERYAPDFVDHSALPGQLPGPAGIKDAVSAFRATIPDLKDTIDAMSDEGDRVLTQETWRGTNPSTGKQTTGTITHIFVFQDGKIVEEWSEGWESLSQLGIS